MRTNTKCASSTTKHVQDTGHLKGHEENPGQVAELQGILFVLIGDYTQLFSELIPGYVLRNHFWWDLGDLWKTGNWTCTLPTVQIQVTWIFIQCSWIAGLKILEQFLMKVLKYNPAVIFPGIGSMEMKIPIYSKTHTIWVAWWEHGCKEDNTGDGNGPNLLSLCILLRTVTDL